MYAQFVETKFMGMLTVSVVKDGMFGEYRDLKVRVGISRG